MTVLMFECQTLLWGGGERERTADILWTKCRRVGEEEGRCVVGGVLVRGSGARRGGRDSDDREQH